MSLTHEKYTPQYTLPAPTCSTLPSTTVPRSLYLDRIGRRSDPLAEYEVRLTEVLFAGQFGAEGCVSSTVTVAVESTKVVEHLVQWSDGCEMPKSQCLDLVPQGSTAHHTNSKSPTRVRGLLRWTRQACSGDVGQRHALVNRCEGGTPQCTGNDTSNESAPAADM